MVTIEKYKHLKLLHYFWASTFFLTIMIRLAFLLIVMVCSQQMYAQKKHALVIAIGSYNQLDGKGWKKISSVNDTSYILPALRKQGFENSNIQLILDEEGTIENIRLALNELLSKIEKKDIVFIHFSAHGAQIEDDNGDELDGLDEAIVTYNAISPRFSTDFKNDSKNYLRDDELGQFITRIRQKAGEKGDVLVIMDNCHSGSGTRNVGITRGGEAPLISKPINYAKQQRDENISFEAPKSEAKMATQVIISASRADQLNTEIRINGKGVGSLSYAVGKAMMNMELNTTYSGFFSKVQSEMAILVPKQHPVIEGTGVNREFWGGAFKVPPPYLKVLIAEDADYITIEGGITSGLTVGSEVHLYPADTYDTTKTKPVSKGIIKQTENYRSFVDLSIDLPEISSSYWVFVKKVNYPVKPFSVSFSAESKLGEKEISTEKQKEINQFLLQNDKIDQNEEIALRYITKAGNDVLVDAKTDFEFFSINKQKDLKGQLDEAVQRYAQYNFLKSYVLSDTNYKIIVRLVPEESNKIQNLNNGAYTFQVGDTFRIEIINHSKFDVFYNVLDLDPEGNINAIFPNKKERIFSHELKVKAGDTLLIPHKINVFDPSGEEIFKLFISKSELDLEGIARSRGENTRNMMTDIEKVFKSSYKPSTRNVSTAKDGVVMNIPFTIVPK
jgi:metacaspase-1